MKSKTSISSKIILTIFMLVIILPVLTLLVWTFTERWAWPDLWPQVFSMRAVDEILRRKEELIKLFASSIFKNSSPFIDISFRISFNTEDSGM